ncbi:MAG: hypothetical protein D6820_16475 [Lentisphaerae bacterium]|nr:MAG: hypothetical protein D6820_16475 [Lentisphaerota bacterium]
MLAVLALAIATPKTFAHCQVPCGIYGDDQRFAAMLEDVKTIRKATTQINLLAKDGSNANQLVRWVLTKEQHADKISETIHYYFLAQRIKEANPKYTQLLVAAHRIIVAAMKTKQAADPASVEVLQQRVVEFQKLYHEATAHKH